MKFEGQMEGVNLPCLLLGWGLTREHADSRQKGLL